MNIDIVREERQLEGVDKWVKAGCFGTLYYATGVGKTYTALLTIDRIEKTKTPIYLISVPSEEIAKQWNRQLEERYTKATLARIIVRTAQQLLLDGVVYEVDMFIVDEGHEYATEERIRIINGELVRYKALLVLTASADDKNYGKIARYAPVIDTITETEAKDKGFIAEFIEYNLGLSLSAKEQESYDKMSEIITENMLIFNKDIRLAQLCISGGVDTRTGITYSAPNWAKGLAVKHGWHDKMNLHNDEEAEIDEKWNPRVIMTSAIRLMNMVRNRRDLLIGCEAKIKTTIQLIKKYNKQKTIVFSESTVFADIIYREVVDKVKAVVYHSNLKTIIRPSDKSGKPIKIGKTRLKREAVEAISSGKANTIITSKALDKAFNVVDLRVGITASGTQNTTQYKQRGGRVKRKELDIFDDCTVLLINLYIKDTQDEKWLRSRQAGIIHTIIDVDSIDQITYKPPINKEYEIE